MLIYGLDKKLKQHSLDTLSPSDTYNEVCLNLFRGIVILYAHYF